MGTEGIVEQAEGVRRDCRFAGSESAGFPQGQAGGTMARRGFWLDRRVPSCQATGVLFGCFLWGYWIRKRVVITKILIEFCTEVAVLVAVFPLLDSIIGNRSSSMQGLPNSGTQSVPWSLVETSWGIAALFLLFAVIMAIGLGD